VLGIHILLIESLPQCELLLLLLLILLLLLLEDSVCIEIGTVLSIIFMYMYILFGARCWCRSWLRHCITNRKVAGSIPDGVIRFFH